jgi:hypothetical protein
MERLCQQVCCALRWGKVCHWSCSTQLALLDSVARRSRVDEAQAVTHRFSQHLSSRDMVNASGMLMTLCPGLAGAEVVMILLGAPPCSVIGETATGGRSAVGVLECSRPVEGMLLSYCVCTCVCLGVHGWSGTIR